MSRKSVLEERDRRERRKQRVQERNHAFEERQRTALREQQTMYRSDQDSSPESRRNALYGETFSVSYQGAAKKKSFSFLRVFARCLITIVIIAIIGLGGSYAAFKYFLYGKANYVKNQGYTIASSVEEEDTVTLNDEVSAEVVQSQKTALTEMADEIKRDTGTYNVLLIGVDRRDDSWYGNSDVMILLTINHDARTIFMTSFLRDLYADIPEVGVRKLNASCAYGGAELCVETIKANYGVEIDNYAMVDFNAMREIIDELGGVDVSIADWELEATNGIINGMCITDGVDASSHLIQSSGVVHMDGYAAVGYSRNRSSGNENDFGRTQRQRKVLTAIFTKAQNGGFTSLTATVQSVLPYITHNVKESTILKMMTQIPDLLKYTMIEVRVPFDNEYYISNEILIPNDIGETIKKIRSLIY